MTELEIIDKLRELKTANTYRQLSILTGVCERTLMRWLEGKAKMSEQTRRALSHVDFTRRTNE